jgi:hypothetical protein
MNYPEYLSDADLQVEWEACFSGVTNLYLARYRRIYWRERLKAVHAEIERRRSPKISWLKAGF